MILYIAQVGHEPLMAHADPRQTKMVPIMGLEKFLQALREVSHAQSVRIPLDGSPVTTDVGEKG